MQKHLDAMVTGDITPTHAPSCQLCYSAEMQADQQPGRRKLPLTLDEGWATALGKPQFCSRLRFTSAEISTAAALAFLPRDNFPAHANPPGHITGHHMWALLQLLSSAGTQRSCRRVQGSASPRCKRLPQQPHCTQTLKTPSKITKTAVN